MIRADPRVLLPLLPIVVAVPAAAGPARPAATALAVAIPAGPLDRALAALAARFGIDIGGTDPGVARTRVPALAGRLTAADALDRLLRGTPFRSQRIDAATFRIVRRAAPSPRRVPPSPAPVPASPPQPDIVVTAAKSTVSPLRLAGAATVLRAGVDAPFGRDALGGMSVAAAGAPILQETALGTGRNKLFIRGVADSSFGGPTQSTAAIYWGDVPVGYTGADPGLNLYDVDRVEILEGPQGTLYGAGAIGGVIRLVPHAPDLLAAHAGLAAGLDLTKGSPAGSDLAAMVNLPLADGVLGLRAVGYRVAEAGYIDDVRRHLADVNDVRTTGGRLTLRAEPAQGWTVDAGAIGQRVVARDLQYAERGLPGLSRAATLAQPFRQDYALGQLRVAYDGAGGLSLVSATGYAARDADSRFDATRGRRQPVAYDTEERGRLFSHETRVSRTRANGAGWLAGVALLRATDRYTRRYGPLDRQRDIVGTANRTVDLALFGQVGVALSPRVTATLGERLTHQRQDGDPVSDRHAGAFIRGVSVTRLDPTLGLSWLVAPATALYARYQSGFRTGGITVAPGIGRVADLAPDTIRVVEAGLRRERQRARGLAGTIGLSATHWRRVQADLVDRTGFPFTANIGDSRILGLEATGDWLSGTGLRLSAATFLGDTRLDAEAAPQSATAQSLRARLPNTPSVAASASAGYDWQATAAARAAVTLDAHYVGRSRLGSIAPFDLGQGGYATVAAQASWLQGRWRWSVGVDNLLDVRGDRFASGNPFAVAVRDVYTPLRPRALRLGIAIR